MYFFRLQEIIFPLLFLRGTRMPLRDSDADFFFLVEVIFAGRTRGHAPYTFL